MNRIPLLIIILICVLCNRNPVLAQSMIFSEDSIVVPSCEKHLSSLDTIDVYNNTDEELLVRWELIQFHFPHDGSYWLIFEPTHFGPFSSSGYVNLEARDTAWIIFYMYHDTLYSGDSALLQIKVFDPLDIANTTQILTAIQYCPLQTSYAEPVIETQLQVFPNPVIDQLTIKIPEHISATSLILFSTTGEVVRKISIADHEITLSRDDLPGGMYFIGLESYRHIVAITKIVVAE